MSIYRFKGTQGYADPRCPVLDPEDAVVLVGYCYGRFEVWRRDDVRASLRHRSEAVRDLLLALFCCGAPRPEVFQLAEIYVGSVIEMVWGDELAALPTSQRTPVVQMMTSMMKEVSWLHFLLGDSADRSLALSQALERLLSFARDALEEYAPEERLDLEICLAAIHRRSLDDLDRDVPYANVSVARALLHRDGDEVARLIDAELRDLLPRVRRLTEGKRELFLDRTKVSRDFGWGFLFTGVRRLAEALGCTVRAPAPDTLVFYL
jgi:hypothetical protein